MVQRINQRAAEIAADLKDAQDKRRELRDTAPVRRSPELLDLMPTGTIDLEALPAPLLRRLLDVFRLRMRVHKAAGYVECEVTIAGEPVGVQSAAARAALGDPRDDTRGSVVYPLPDSNRRYRLERAAS